MQVRRMRVVAGCAVAAVAAASVLGAGTAVASSDDGVRTVAAPVWTEAQSVHTAAGLARVSPAARALATRPVIETVEIKHGAPGTLARTSAYSTGGSRTIPGCGDVVLTTIRRNAFGLALMTARTTVRNWCNTGTAITSEPTAQRSVSTSLDWLACGWNNDYAGWLQGRTRFGVGGDAMFARGTSCAGATPQMHNEIEVLGNGEYHWTY
jgi:hypothetical protein